MPANLNLCFPGFAGDHPLDFSICTLYDQILIGHPLIKLLVYPTQKIHAGNNCSRSILNAGLDALLHFYMRFTFQLPCSFRRIPGKVFSHSAINIYRMSVVPLYKIGIVTVHFPYQLHYPPAGDRMNSGTDAG